jgi:DNA processing protein
MQRPSQAVVLALVEAADTLADISRHRLADVLETLGSTEPLTSRSPSGLEPVGREALDRLRGALTQAAVDRWDHELRRLNSDHPAVGLVTVLDDTYPLNLRQVYDKAPFLFYRGAIGAARERAVAVVGTRRPSPGGVEQARRLAWGLARAGTVVVSGLAAGIDTAAHEAALDAGGPTVAVLAHGILDPVYPAENRALGERIVESGGALISQYWPDQHPTRATFPARNVTTSGLSLGTVVVEAGETSGARQQARRCIEHGKQLFLLSDLVASQDWARRYAERAGVAVVDDVSGVLSRLGALLPTEDPVQLAFG